MYCGRFNYLLSSNIPLGFRVFLQWELRLITVRHMCSGISNRNALLAQCSLLLHHPVDRE